MVTPDPPDRPAPPQGDPTPTPDQGETARLLQEHPPPPVPPRVVAPAPEGLVAHTLLGHRVCK